MSDNGYVYAYRGAWSHPAFNNLREAAIWNFLYQNAFWQDGDRNFNGYTFRLKRGQIIVSIAFLAKGFGMTEKGVRVVIQKLEKLGMVGVQGASRGTIITICNYEKYQTFQKPEGERKGNRRANEGRAEGDNKKEVSKVKEDKELIAEAVSGWNDLASRVGLSACQKVTDGRKSALMARLKDAGGIEGWKAALEKIESSDFCTGKKTTWKANIDFVLQESSFTKLMEGAYDNHSKPTTRDNTIDQLRDWVASGGAG